MTLPRLCVYRRFTKIQAALLCTNTVKDLLSIQLRRPKSTAHGAVQLVQVASLQDSQDPPGADAAEAEDLDQVQRPPG